MKSNKPTLAKTSEDATVADKAKHPAEGVSFPIVGIGASAGGLEAFTELLKHLPLDTGMAFVLVQHLDPEHESALTAILTRATLLPVNEITNNLRVEPNRVYIIPPNMDLSITQGVLNLQPRPSGRTPHRSIDFFFESLAQDQREHTIGVILSGTANDGTLGLEAIKAEGGITFAQDDSAKYDSMPRSAIAAGCVDLVLSPENIAKELARIAMHPYIVTQRSKLPTSPEDDWASATAHEDDDTPLPSGGQGTPSTGAEQAHSEAERGTGEGAGKAKDGFKKVILLLRNHSGVDFSLYKSTTIQRRITRRMVLNRNDTPESYADFLKGNTKELDALYSDVLISVTTFFRNPEAFDVLQSMVFPKLLQQRGDDPIRVWTLGCSTGQEAYSIAMAYMECAENAPRMRKLQVFATDLNNTLLDKARQGLYARSLAVDISPERLRRFFVEEEGGYRVVKWLREMVVFARQNLISDPPFSRMDLISCRNLLIYLEPSLQKKAMPTFHYALKPEGFLFLGASESIGSFTDLFAPADKKYKIYSKKASAIPSFHLPVKKERGDQPLTTQMAPSTLAMGQAESPEGFRAELNAQREADRVTVNQFAPPGVLINADLQILQFRGPTGAYLQPPSGKASFDVLKMAREGLMLPLHAAINEAKQENKTTRKENVRIEQDGKTWTVNVEVIPLKNLKEQCFLIMFEEAQKAGRTGDSASSPETIEPHVEPAAKEDFRRINELETELSETRDYLQSIQEQQEAANEELQSANEEVQSANEELQSLNEELETSKEELESTNEELVTVNEEMTNRNTEMSRLNNDLVNLQASTKLIILLLGRDLTIRRFSAQAQKQFNLLDTDVGRPIGNIRHNLAFDDPGLRAASTPIISPPPEGRTPEAIQSSPDLESFVAEVIANVRESEHEVRDRAGHWFSLRVRPYITLDNKVEGAVLVLIDIDAFKRSEQTISAARDYAEAIVRTVHTPLLILSADLRVHGANEAFYSTFKVSAAESGGRLIYDLGNGQWNIPQLRILLEEMLPRNSFFNNFEITHDFETLGRRTMLLNARMLKDSSGLSANILLGIEDITERKREEGAGIRLAAIVEYSEDAIVSKDLDGIITTWNRGAQRLFGYTAQEAVGQLVSILIPPGHEDEEPRIIASIKKGVATENYETVRCRKDGSQIDISLTVSPIKDAQGRIIGASKIARNITERKQAEKLLQEEKRKAEAANQAKTEFLSNMSHEIRTPMNAVLGLSNILAMSQDIPKEKQQEIVSTLQLSAQSLLGLINDLLDIAKIETNNIDIERIPFTFNEVISEVFSLLSLNTQEKGITLGHVNSPLNTKKFLGDPLRIRQVLVNLVSNAIKFTEQGGVTVSMTTSPDEEPGSCYVHIAISDTGIGIAPGKLEGIFEKFTQADSSTTRKYGGTGLGLAISKNLTEIMGGSITIKSDPGKGSEFTLNLPLELADEASAYPAIAEGDQKEPLKLQATHGCILLVEDYKPNVLVAVLMLESLGYSCDVASNGKEALDIIHTNRGKYVAVLMDIQMPIMDGYEAIKIIREEEKAKNLPRLTIIAMTAHALKGDRERCLEAGMDDYISKPFKPQQLKDKVASVVKGI